MPNPNHETVHPNHETVRPELVEGPFYRGGGSTSRYPTLGGLNPQGGLDRVINISNRQNSHETLLI
jgi:hypothetical protein